MFRTGYRRKSNHEKICKCSHPNIAHYTQGGHCVSPECGCLEYRAKGRPEFQNKRARCQYGHSHDSGLEIKTCFDLHCLKQTGNVKDFSFHPVVDLLGPSGKVVATYEVDFLVQYPEGTVEYVECKGDHLAREMGWRIKWALLIDKHRDDPKYKFRIRRG